MKIIAECTVSNCKKSRHNGQRLCSAHAARKRRGASMEAPVISKWGDRVCTITGCPKIIKTRLLCVNHARISSIYKLSAMQLDQIFRQGKCSICSKELVLGKFTIDHDHACCDREGSCGKCIRGLLCPLCNLGLGAFGDDVNKMKLAIDYLSKKIM